MVRTGVFVRACTALAADSGSRRREMRNAVIRRPNVRLTCAAGSFSRSARLAARDAHEKCTKFGAAPAASGAGRVGPQVVKCRV